MIARKIAIKIAAMVIKLLRLFLQTFRQAILINIIYFNLETY